MALGWPRKIGRNIKLFVSLSTYVYPSSSSPELIPKQIKEQLKAFQNMTPEDASFLPALKNLMKVLMQHMDEEENDDLPRLEKALSEADSEKLGTSFGRTKMFVPSRSHPSAPNKPPYETAVGLMTAPIDHVADFFRKWPESTANPNPSAK